MTLCLCTLGWFHPPSLTYDVVFNPRTLPVTAATPANLLYNLYRSQRAMTVSTTILNVLITCASTNVCAVTALRIVVTGLTNAAARQV